MTLFALSLQDSLDATARDTKSRRQLGVAEVLSEDLERKYLVGGQFFDGAPQMVGDVPMERHPFQVFDAVIEFVTVFVIDLKRRTGGRADKRQRDQHMDARLRSFESLIERNSGIPRGIGRRLDDMPRASALASFLGADTPKVADGVQMVGGKQPIFARKVNLFSRILGQDACVSNVSVESVLFALIHGCIIPFQAAAKKAAQEGQIGG